MLLGTPWVYADTELDWRSKTGAYLVGLVPERRRMLRHRFEERSPSGVNLPSKPIGWKPCKCISDHITKRVDNDAKVLLCRLVLMLGL